MSAIINKGDKVVFSTRERETIIGKFSHIAPNGKAYVKGDDGKSYERPLDKLKKIGEASTEFHVSVPNLNLNITKATKEPTKVFDINQRFHFLENMVRMVINKTSISMIITGEGGLGKTWTVMRQIENKRLSENNDYVQIKGYSTARGLYRCLFENNGKIIIFDDIDSILDEKVALNILKSALDSYDTRMIHWMSQSFDESIPSYFEFTGRIIFISNKDQSEIDQALLSRSMSIDLTMSVFDKIERMKKILPNIKTTVSMDIKQECLDLVNEHKEQCHDLNMRTLLKVIDMRIDPENQKDWKDMAIYAMVNTVS